MSKIFTDEENNAWAHQLTGKMTSACLAVRHHDTVLMVKANYKNHWTFPSGIVDDGESPKTAALRETFEETGLDFQESDCVSLGIIYTASNGADRDRFNVGFLVDIDDISSLSLTIPNEEIEDAKWVHFDQVADLAGGKASYGVFQDILLGQKPMSLYSEIKVAAVKSLQ